MSAKQPLKGYTVALPETRQLDVLAGLLDRRGARLWRAPMVAIKDAPDPAPVEQWLQDFAARPPDDLILLTGEGLRRLWGCAGRLRIQGPFRQALGQVRKITRGPKPARALKEVGLATDVAAPAPTTEGIIAALQQLDIKRHSIAVQLYGTEPNRQLQDFLRSVDVAEIRTVAPYVYTDASDDEQVLQLIEALAGGEIDAIAFTSQPQLRRLRQVARTAGMEDTLMDALARVCVAAVGPVMALALKEASIKVDVVPEDSFFMKPLVTALVEALTGIRESDSG